MESSGRASRGPRFYLVQEGNIHTMRKTKGTEVAEPVENKQEPNQEKPKATKTKRNTQTTHIGSQF